MGTGTVRWDEATLKNITTNCGGTLTLTLARDPIALTSDFTSTSPKYITHCHVKKFLTSIKSGDKVLKGDIIGYVGGGEAENDPGRGNSSHRHLHMSYRTKDKVALNPARWLPGVGGEQAAGSKTLYNYEHIDAMPGKDANGNYIVRPLDGKTGITIRTITPGEDEKEDAMMNPGKKDEQKWYLVRDGFFKQTGFWNDTQAYVRISTNKVNAKVLDSIEYLKYDPDWFDSGANIFKKETYRGNTKFPTYNKDEFEHDICNFPLHMHYDEDGKQLVPNEAATWFSEWEVPFSNDVGPNIATTTTEAKVHNKK